MTLKKNILFSCAGGIFSIQNIIAINKIKDFKFNIHGIDINKVGIPNKDFFLKVSICPNPLDKAELYLRFIKNYCRQNKIDVFLPFSDSEIELLCNVNFTNLKTKIVLPSKKNLDLLSDKYKFLSYLNEKKIIDEKVFKLDSISDLENILGMKKINSKQVVLKPRKSRGSRGVLIINEKVNFFEPVKNRNCAIGPKKNILDFIIRNEIKLNNFFLMNYHSNKNYDVDCYASNSKIKHLVVRERNWENHLSSVNVGCRIVKNLKIEKLVEKIICELNISGILDLDLSLDQNNEPHIIDVSSRLSGSVSAGMIAGFNIFEVILKDLFGIKFNRKLIKKAYTVRLGNIFIDKNLYTLGN